MPDQDSHRRRRSASFSLRALFIVTTASALVLWAIVSLYSAWLGREIVMGVQPNQISVSVFDGHTEAIMAACPSIKKLTVDRPANTIWIVCEYRHSSAARGELSPFLASPQLLNTAEMLDLPLSEVLAMSRGLD